MTTYTITTTVTSPDTKREQMRINAAREIYKQLLKYYGEKALRKTA